jgi:hypothetical protein
MAAKSEFEVSIGAAISGPPPVSERSTARARVEALAIDIVRARAAGWQIEQIANALNEQFRVSGIAEINHGTFCKYLSQLMTRHRIGQLELNSNHANTHEIAQATVMKQRT